MDTLAPKLQDLLDRLLRPGPPIHSPWQAQVSAVSQALGSCRFLSIFLLGNLLLLLVFGFSFHMMGIGILGLLASLAPFTKVANVPFMRLAAPREVHTPFVSPPVKVWFIVHVALRIIAAVLWLAAAIYLLTAFGFCGQNLICLLASSLGSR
jgi:hypothetical protein